jgi:hypothetical protein
MSAAIRTRSSGYFQLLAQLMRDRHNRGMLVRVTWVLLAAAVCLSLVGYFMGRRSDSFGLSAFLLCGGLFMWCGTFLNSAVRQNIPSNACLVPKLRGRLMVLTAALYMGSALFSATVLSLFFGHFGYLILLTCLLGVHSVFVARYQVLAVLQSLAIIAAISYKDQLWSWLQMAGDSVGEPVIAAGGLLLLGALGALGLHLVFLRGGDRHWDWMKKQAARPQFGQTKVERYNDTGAKARWKALWYTGYMSALRRDCRGGATQGNMMMHAIGPGAHHGTSIGMAGMLTLVTIIGMSLLSQKTDVFAAMVQVSLMQVFVMMACMMLATGMVSAVVGHSVEQFLYLLTPAAPMPAEVNRLLIRAMLVRFLRVWLAGAGCAVAIDMLTTHTLALRGPTFMMAMIMLCFVFVMLRNYAKMPSTFNELLTVVGSLVVVAVYAWMLLLEQRSPDFPWFWAGGTVGALIAAAVWLRCRRLLAMPALLPAGRLQAE